MNRSNRRLSAVSYRRARLVLLWCILAVWIATYAQANSLHHQIDQMLADPNLNHGIQAVLVKSLQTGKTLYERNADLAMIPASNMKLLVSAAALDRLGPDFTYVTKVFTCAPVNPHGLVKGSIALVGGGDPTLETNDLVEMAQKLKTQGIKKVTGDLIVDDSLFDDCRLGTGWPWNDLCYYYSAEITALNLNRNVVNVWVYPGKKPGDPAIVQLDPVNSFLQIESCPITGETDSQKTVWVYRVLGTNIIRAGGSIPVGTKVTASEAIITIHEPALYTGHVFKNELHKQGIVVEGEVKRGKIPSDATLLCEHVSPPLSKILELLNKPSDNLIAEILLKTLGAFVKGKGSAECGREVEKEFMTQIGIDLGGIYIADGSGLSRLNCVTARSLVELLSHMYRHPHARAFIDSLPLAGVDGTLKNRMKGTSAENNVRAKTGYLSRVSSLSGYLTTKSGEPLVFSILMNNHPCPNSAATAVQNKICELLANSSE